MFILLLFGNKQGVLRSFLHSVGPNFKVSAPCLLCYSHSMFAFWTSVFQVVFIKRLWPDLFKALPFVGVIGFAWISLKFKSAFKHFSRLLVYF